MLKAILYLVGKANEFAHLYKAGRRARRGTFAASLKGLTSSELLSLSAFYARNKSYRRMYLCLRALVINPDPETKKLFLSVRTFLNTGQIEKATALFCEISDKAPHSLSNVGILGAAFNGKNKNISNTFVAEVLRSNKGVAAYYLYVVLCRVKKAHDLLPAVTTALPPVEDVIAYIAFSIVHDKKSAALISQLIEALVRDKVLSDDDVLLLRDIQADGSKSFINLSDEIKLRLARRVEDNANGGFLDVICALTRLHRLVGAKLQPSTIDMKSFCGSSAAIVVLNRLPVEIFHALQVHEGKRASVLGIIGVCSCPEGVAYHRIYNLAEKVSISEGGHLVTRAHKLSQHIKDIVFSRDTIQAHGEFLEEVFALTLEDSIFKELRVHEGVRAYLAEQKIERVLFALNPYVSRRLLDMLQDLAEVVDVYVHFDASFANQLPFQKNQSDIHKFRSINQIAGNPSRLIDATTLVAAVDRQYPCIGRLVMGQGYVPPFSGPADMLLASVAADQNYHAAFSELMSCFSQEFRLSAIELTGKPLPANVDRRALSYFSVPPAPLKDICDVSFMAADIEKVLGFAQKKLDGIGKHILACMDSIEVCFARVFPTICMQAGQIYRHIETQNIPIVATMPGRSPILRAVTLWANRYNRQTIDFQAFFISANPRYRRSLARKYCGITTEQVDLYVREMQPQDQQILRIGSLPIDMNIKKIKSQTYDRNFADFKYDEKLKYVVFAAQHGLGDENNQIIDVLLGMAPVDGVHVIIKLHPRTSAQDYEALKDRVKALPNAVNYSVVHKENIYKVLKIASLAMTQFSNVGMEAAILGLPVLVINLDKRVYPVDLCEMGMANEAFSPEEIVSGISSLIFDETARSDLLRRQEIFFTRNPELKTNDAAQRALRFVKNEIEPTVVV